VPLKYLAKRRTKRPVHPSIIAKTIFYLSEKKANEVLDFLKQLYVQEREEITSKHFYFRIKTSDKKRRFDLPEIICIAQNTLLVVYNVGYTCRHLYQRVEERKGLSSIGNHIKEHHGTVPSDISRDFKILRIRLPDLRNALYKGA